MARERTEQVLKEASILPGVVTYHLIAIIVGLGVTVVGIPLLLIAVPFAMWYYPRYYRRLRVILTRRELKVHRGIFVTEEKSIPLEKITDLAVYQGPVMRHFGLKGIRIETAGQTSQGGALVTVIGIDDTDGFRDLVLTQRDRIADEDDSPSMPAAAPAQRIDELLPTLSDIRDTLLRIEDALRRDGGPGA